MDKNIKIGKEFKSQLLCKDEKDFIPDNNSVFHDFNKSSQTDIINDGDLVLNENEFNLGNQISVLDDYEFHKGELNMLDVAYDSDNESKEEKQLVKAYEILKGICNIDFKNYRQNFILFNMEKRMEVTGVYSMKDYVSILETDRKECSLLIDSLIVGTTRFFRDSDAFEVLRENAVPQILEQRDKSNCLRIWVVGCSTGEEAYSVAILFKEYIIKTGINLDVKIYATDVDVNAVEYASKGLYHENILEDVSIERINKFFVKINNKYQITRQIRDMVEFSVHNVVDNPPFFEIDFISCRNLLIYYTPLVQKRVISLFHFSLKKDCFLMLGTGERVNNCDFFKIFNNKWRIYKHNGINKRRAMDNLKLQGKDDFYFDCRKAVNNNNDSDYNYYEITNRLISDYMPSSIIMNGKGEIIQTCGKVNKDFLLPEGVKYKNTIKMLPGNLSDILTEGLKRVSKEKEVVYPGVKINVKDMIKVVNIIIKDFDYKKGNLFIAIFEDRESIMKQHFNEDQLKDSTFLHDKTLHVSNSKNDHIIRSTWIQDLNKDIINFFSNTYTGTLFLDSNLCIVDFTPSVAKEIGISKKHIGVSLGNIEHSLIGEDLYENSLRVVKSHEHMEKEVQSANGNWYIIKYNPYKNFQGVLLGIVIILIDTTKIKISQDKLLQLSYAIDQSSTIVMITDLKGKIEYANNNFLKVTCSSFEEVFGNHPKMLRSNMHDSEFYQNIWRTIYLGKEWKGELFYKNSEGVGFWFSTAISPVMGKNGIVSNYIAIMEDITERKNMIETLKCSEGKFKLLFNNAKDLIFIYSFNAKGMPGKIDDVNITACEVLGYDKEQLITMTSYDIISEDCIGDIPKFNQRLLTNGNDTYETSYVLNNGNKIPVEVHSHIFFFNGEKYVLTTARDISRRKKYEEGLRKSRERYKHLVQSSPFGIFIIKKALIVFSNKAGIKLLGAKCPTDVTGESLERYFNNISEEILLEMSCTGNDNENRVFEDKVLRSDGTEGYVEITVMPFWFEGEETIIMMARDITGQKHAEYLEKDIEKKNRLLCETLEYDTLKTEFFSNLSHEFRTPLNVMIGTLQLLNMYLKEQIICDDSNMVSKYTNIIKHNCYRLLRLVNNMIDITSIDIGFYELNLSNYDIVSIVEDITIQAARYLDHKGIEVVFDTEVEERVIACDGDRIEGIVLNLISNAVKCIKLKGKINVNIYNFDERIRISVKDTGIGIPDDKLEIIFQKFRQVDKTLTRKHEGSGIGLSLVKSIVEMHDGKIWVESEYGKGSEFIVELPAKTITVDNEAKNSNKVQSIPKNVERIQIEFSDIDI